MISEDRNTMIDQYAKLALENFRNTGGTKATEEMIDLQTQLGMTHANIMLAHQEMIMGTPEKH